MGWRIAEYVVRGEIDARQKGVVNGQVWLHGRSAPVRVNLSGLPMPDLAGCLLTFVNPSPQPGLPPGFHTEQQGVCGDLTASRRVAVVDLPLEEVRRLASEDKPVPTRQANAIYLEWFSARNGRVVIEATNFRVAVSPPLWQLTKEEAERRRVDSNAALLRFLDGTDSGWIGPHDDPDEAEPEGPVDEFAWEKMLKESDARSDRLGELMQKYEGHPDSERLVAREMGWTWVEDELDGEDRGLFDEEDAALAADAEDAEEDGDLDELVPNPLTEGRDWIRDDSGDIQHPLCHRTFKLGMRMWRYADEFGLLSDEANRSVADLVINTQICSAKLAGALNDLAYDLAPEPGLVVASLKRALKHLHIAMQAGDTAVQSRSVESSLLEQWRRELFEIREEILRLMNEHRRRIGT